MKALYSAWSCYFQNFSSSQTFNHIRDHIPTCNHHPFLKLRSRWTDSSLTWLKLECCHYNLHILRPNQNESANCTDSFFPSNCKLINITFGLVRKLKHFVQIPSFCSSGHSSPFHLLIKLIKRAGRFSLLLPFLFASTASFQFIVS